MELAAPNTFSNVVSDRVSLHIRFYEQLKSSRGNFETQWQQISELVFPQDGSSFQGTRDPSSQGQKLTSKLYDSTANIALSRFMAIMDSLLTPHNQTWHRMTTDDPMLNKNKSVQIHFDEVTRILFRERYLDTSNFIEQNQQIWTGLGAYGTGALFTDHLWGNPGIRYKHIHLGEFYFSENHQGVPDKVYRHYRLTARQAMQKWGEKCPNIIKTMMATNPEAPYEFLHCVVPREDYDPNRKDFRGMPWESLDISITGRTLLSESGYRTFPYSISRYTQSLSEVYGRSPAMDVLPTIKTLNEQKKALLKQAHRILDPVLLVHDDGVLNTMSAMPGSTVAGGVSESGQKLVHTLDTGNIQAGMETMKIDQDDIKDAFLTSLFQILVETPEMTATEVMERVKEKSLLIAPTIGRQETYLSRVINRELDILSQQGKIPPMPPLLKSAGGQYKIRFESPLARMRRSEEASGLMRMLETSLQIVQSTQDPTPMFYFNFDQIIPDMAEIQGLPAKWIKTLDEVNQMKAAQQQKVSTDQLIQAGPSAAAVIKATAGK